MASILQNHFVLAVHDLHASAKFFEALGFAVSREPPGWIFLQRDNCMVMLGHCADALPPRDLGDHNYFGYLRVDNVDEYYKEVLKRGVTVGSPIATKPWEMREFSVVSPEGHRLTIGQIVASER
jgi:predicted enzyme related to lactoylglutathione lyase